MGSGESQSKLRHEEFLIDARLKEPLDMACMEEDSRVLSEKIMMAVQLKPLSDLVIKPATDEEYPGYSWIQLITTSDMAFHYFYDDPGNGEPPQNPSIHFNVYSCKKLVWQDVIKVLHEHLGLDTWRATFIVREMQAKVSRKVFELAGRGDKAHDELLILSQGKY